MKNPIIATTGWASKSQLLEYIASGFEPVTDTKGQTVNFTISTTGAIECIKNRSETQSHVISVLQNLGGPQKASGDLGQLSAYFDYPKPVSLLKYLVSMIAYDECPIVLDFFSGSATTAHAVMQLNAEDGGHRKFIMVQLPEKCDESSEAYKAGYKTICDIGKERIRRAGEKIKAEKFGNTEEYDNSSLLIPNSSFDIGFRVFRVASPNTNDVYLPAADYDQTMLVGMESNLRDDRTDLDLLFGCLLDWGLPLSLPYSSESIDGCTVHTYNDGDLIACFDANVPESVIETIAKRQPLRAVFRDSSFSTSPAKINVTEIFKYYAPDTRVKVI